MGLRDQAIDAAISDEERRRLAASSERDRELDPAKDLIEQRKLFARGREGLKGFEQRRLAAETLLANIPSGLNVANIASQALAALEGGLVSERELSSLFGRPLETRARATTDKKGGVIGLEPRFKPKTTIEELRGLVAEEKAGTEFGEEARSQKAFGKDIGELQGALSELIKQKRGEIQKGGERAGQELLEQQLGIIAEREGFLLEEVKKSREQITGTLDTMMANLLKEAGFVAGQARSQFGGQLAARGVERSTTAQRGLEESFFKESEQKAGIRERTAQAREEVTGLEARTREKIEGRRAAVELSRTLEGVQSFLDVGFNVDIRELEESFNQSIQTMELEALEKESLAGLFGGIAKGAGSILGFI